MSGRRGRKRLQSNADEVNAKRSKTTNNDDDEESEVEPQQLKKTATKGKGKKGKQSRCVMYISVIITNLQCFGRMTAAQRAAKDNIEDSKGVPANLTPYVLFLAVFLFFSLSNLIHSTQQG